MNLLASFVNNFKLDFANNLQQVHLLIAVSGGLDSVVLADLCFKAGIEYTIAHCNFQLRGEESKRDEAFVASLSLKYDKPFLLQTFETEKYAQETKQSIQVAARILRYTWFEEALKELQAIHLLHEKSNIKYYIATAHHADDNIETLLLQFFRGTGISGLHGILPIQGNIIRPLLFANRNEILAYAEENKLSWVEDSSNSSDKYARNFVRHQVVPLLQQIYPKVEENLLNNIERFKEVEQIYQASINQVKKKLIEEKGKEWHIPILKLKKQSPLKTIVYEIIKDYGFAASQTDEAIKLLDAANGSYMASASHRLIINRHWLIIAPVETTEINTILIEATDEKVDFKHGSISFSLRHLSRFDAEGKPKLSTDATIAMLDAADIHYPLLLRPWKQGDYFYPLGMTKKKKLSKFFIDQKLSKTQKEQVWVLESNKRILWVIGYRIDNRFKVLDNTKRALVLNWKK